MCIRTARPSRTELLSVVEPRARDSCACISFRTFHSPFFFLSSQPVTQLSAGQCLSCGVFQNLLLRGSPAIGIFTVCDTNFTGGVFNYVAPGALNITLSCPKCTGGGVSSPTSAVPSSTPPSSTPSPSSSTPASTESGECCSHA